MTNSYNPLTAVNTEDQFKRNFDAQQQSLSKIFGEAEKDDQTRIDNLKSLNSRNTAALESLSKFSTSLMEGLIERKKEENEELMNQGIVDSFYQGVDQQQIDEVNTEEAALVQASSDINNVSDKIQDSQGHGLVAEKVRSTNPWYKYGQYIGQVQTNVSMLSQMRQYAQEHMFVEIDGTPYAFKDLKEPEQYQAWDAKFNQKFLAQFPGVNPAVAQKYIFPYLQRNREISSAEWSTERDKRLKVERKEQASDRVTVAMFTPQFGEVWLREQDAGNLTRREAVQLIVNAVDDELITRQQRDTFLAHTFNHRGLGPGTTIKKAFARDFAQLDQKFAKREQTALVNEDVRQRTEMQNFAKEFHRIRGARDGRFSESEINEFKKQLINEKGIDPSRVNTFFQNVETSEDVDLQEARDRLNELRSGRGRGYLIPQDLVGMPAEIQNEFEQHVQTDADLAETYTQLFKDTEEEIEAAVRDDYTLQFNQIPKNERAEYEMRVNNAQAAFKEQFFDLLRTGEYTVKEARITARDNVFKNIDKKTYTRDDLYGPGSVSIDDADRKRGQAVDNARLQLEGVKNSPGIDTVTYLSNNVLPGSEEYLNELIQHKETGSGGIPDFYYQLARRSGMPAIDLAHYQLIASGDKEGYYKTRPKAESIVDEQDPEVQRLLRYLNTPSRTIRASYNGQGGQGDVGWFLDTIASVESEAFGGYDAYNMGGAENGYRAISPGNSRLDNRFGKPISQMTIGEIIELGNKGQVFAVGRYQFIPMTFKEVFADLKRTGVIDESDLFSGAMQDLFALTRARQRISWPGQNNRQGLVNEWRGLKFVRPDKLEEMLQIIRSEPYLQLDVLTPGITN